MRKGQHRPWPPPMMPFQVEFWRKFRARRAEISCELFELGWRIWALEQEDARLAHQLKQAPGA